MTSSLRTTDPDPDDVAMLAFTVWGYKQGELVSLMIHLGHRLGLYRELAGVEHVTPGELAERTGLAERWLREWLHGQAAAGLLEHEDGSFDPIRLRVVGLPDLYEVTAKELSRLLDASVLLVAPFKSEGAERALDVELELAGLRCLRPCDDLPIGRTPIFVSAEVPLPLTNVSARADLQQLRVLRRRDVDVARLGKSADVRDLRGVALDAMTSSGA